MSCLSKHTGVRCDRGFVVFDCVPFGTVCSELQTDWKCFIMQARWTLKVCSHAVSEIESSPAGVAAILKIPLVFLVTHNNPLYKHWKLNTTLCKKTMCENKESIFLEAYNNAEN